MKIQFNVLLTAYNGVPIKLQGSEDQATLSELVQFALTGQFPVDANSTFMEKLKLYELAKKIEASGNGYVDIKAEDVVKIKERIGMIPNVLVAGAALQALEGLPLNAMADTEITERDSDEDAKIEEAMNFAKETKQPKNKVQPVEKIQ